MRQDSYVSLDGRGQLYTKQRHDGFDYVCCIFSTQRTHLLSRATTLRGQGQKHYWLVRQMDEVSFGVRGADGDFLPFGTEAIIPLSELLTYYSPEVAVFEERLLTAAKEHDFQMIGDRRSILRIDQANVRGLFGIALKYIKARKLSRARVFIRELLRLTTEYAGRDQFLFNDFGIRLRKVRHYEGAVLCYRRGLVFTQVDDHLYYNLARAYYEQGQWWDCMNALVSCFDLNPVLPVARDLVVLVMALADSARLRMRYGKPPVPDGVARRAEVLGEAAFIHDETAQETARELSVRKEDKAKEDLWLPGRDIVGM
ncbi:hypothetical protein SYK_18350 [Pseudodesulfovibrio nedwellii]|uniref:Tetratricopeptide repeat protein n=1 Tax=Pseudodesulfovibrio nedwellii TaxID=2973072 RepID=A0ABM8B109_9BACT|nr:hypothetical protein [Pseudodesulfovibrio nedwellii]BDQ37475.1 hypothetical protein SYK_18350 [Pseudodesulfovibrio nedwellii]